MTHSRLHETLAMLTVMGVLLAGCADETEPDPNGDGDRTAASAVSNESTPKASNPSKPETRLAKTSSDIGDVLLDDDATEEDRQNLARDWYAAFSATLEAYESANEEEKVAILDRYIDQEVENQKKWNEQWAKMKASGSGKDIAQKKIDMFVGRTPEQRKAKSEMRTAEYDIRTKNFYTAVYQRAEQRGVDLKWGGGK